jgi:hypothetical protein
MLALVLILFSSFYGFTNKRELSPLDIKNLDYTGGARPEKFSINLKGMISVCSACR